MIGQRGAEPDGADRTRAAYDAWHESHVSGVGPWYELARQALQRRPELLKGARVLEIGCGGGDFALWMAGQGAESVAGADFSPVAIEHAQAVHKRDNLAFTVEDIESIAHPQASFDLVVSCETIEHVPRPAVAVAELARVLRPGGVLLLSTPNYMSITGLHRVWREVTGRSWDEGGQPLVHWTTLPRTSWWLRRAGLTVRRMSADGWYIPVPRRPGGYAWRPPRWALPVVGLVAEHVLLEAGKPRG